MSVKRRIVRKEKEEITVLEVFEMFCIEKKSTGRSEKTIRNYEESLKRFLQIMQCENFKIGELERDDIQEFVECMQSESVRIDTINHYLRDLRTFFNWCWKENYIEQIKIAMVKGQEAIKETYTEEELIRLLENPIGDNYCEWRCWAIINWILSTGNREKTICNIQMKNINLQEKEIILSTTKNKRVQVIPMSTELSFVLRKFIRDFRSEAEEEEYLFCNVAGEQMTENALRLSIRDYNLSRGVEKTSVHSLRHTFSKMWIKNGGDAFRLQKMLGHSSLDMTRKYVNMFSSDLAAGFDEISPLDRMKMNDRKKHVIKRKRA